MAIETDIPGYGATWRRYDAMEQRLSAPLTERMLDLAELRPGMRVLDLATGRGEPAIPAAHRVHPNGTVFGVDIDESVLQLARERAHREGVKNVTFSVSDVETLDDHSDHIFDVALARWGIMYVRNPVRALQAVRRRLAERGSLVVAVWVDPGRASFSELPRAALSKVTSIPPANHDQPGTFYYSSLERLKNDVEIAGFRVEHTEVIEVDVMEASSGAELIAWAREIGASRLLNNVAPHIQSQWENEVIAAAEPYRGDDGVIRLGGLSRIVVVS